MCMSVSTEGKRRSSWAPIPVSRSVFWTSTRNRGTEDGRKVSREDIPSLRMKNISVMRMITDMMGIPVMTAAAMMRMNPANTVTDIINRLRFSIKVKSDIVNVYNMIAEAESTVHGTPVTDIHFHEVGTMDAIMDVAAVCYIMDKLSPDQVCASPVHVGSGTVQCAHGVLPVPAPATAEILRDVPIYGGEIQGELCTPTGAALVKYFVTEFGSMPAMKTEKIGYGIGSKDFGRLNCIRAMIGDTNEARESVLEMTANIDDMTAEEIGFAMERLFDAGALDVFTTPIGMKKSRPGTMLHVLCRPARRELLAGAIFKYTTTLGIREQEMKRHVLSRKIREVETEYGTVRVKISSGYGVKRRKIEYDDLAKIAKEKAIPLSEVKKSVEKGMKPRKTYRID